jgi:hypothetical protein
MIAIGWHIVREGTTIERCDFTTQRPALKFRLQYLLPQVADEEIAAFDSTEGHDLVVKWWAVTDAMLLNA